MNQYLMAVDAGTGSIRAVIFDLSLNQISYEQKEWTHLSDPAYPGSMDFDFINNYELMIECISGAIKKAGIGPKEIIAVSTTSMREGIVLYDKSGRELWACANVDSRSSEEVEKLKKISENYEKDIYAISGQTFALGSIPRLLWIKNNKPEIYEKITTITMINDWIAYKLTGVFAVEPSNCCTTGIFSLEHRDWDKSIAKKCGLKEDIYPDVLESGSVLAKISREVSARTGLSEKCLVVMGGGDTQLGCVGIGAVVPGQISLLGGSFWQYVANIDNTVVDKDCRIRVNCHSVENTWQYELIAFFPGLILRWFRDAFCQQEKYNESSTGIDAYSLLDKEASEVPAGSNGMMCIFSDMMNYISWKHAAPSFINFSIDSSRFDRKVFYRSILENAAIVTFGHAKIIESIINCYPGEIILASGAAKSSLWSQIVADALGVVVKVPKVKEATAMGAAIYAGIGAGIFKDLASAVNEFCNFEKNFEPDSKNHSIYRELFEKWHKIYETALKNSDRGLTRHMWKAPGL